MATAEYDKMNCTRINLKLNNKTDADIIRKLNRVENTQGYIKSLIRENMKEEKKMTSRLFYRGSKVGDTVIDDMIANLVDDDHDYETMRQNYVDFMIGEMEKLDDRLWWQPETSEIFYQDDETGKPLPEDFESWWDETNEKWANEI